MRSLVQWSIMMRKLVRGKALVWTMSLVFVFGAFAPFVLHTDISSAPRFSTAIAQATEQTTNNSTAPQQTYTGGEDANATSVEDLLDCSWYNVVCGIVIVINWLLQGMTGLIASTAGTLMDFFLDLTLSSQNYKQNIDPGENGFISQGWRIVRDLTNLIFIFGLVYAAILFIVGGTLKSFGGDPKRMVVWIVVMALLVNFSIFFARVVIDVGNILGRAFYDRITITAPPVSTPNDSGVNMNSGGNSGFSQGNTDVKQISTAVLEKVEVQDVIMQAGTAFSGMTSGEQYIFVLFLSFIIGIFNLFLAYIFITMGFFFLARTVGLWFAMILSPMAFALYAVPIEEPTIKKYLGFEGWISTLCDMAFQAPLFLFFVYLALTFLDTPTIPTPDDGITGFIWVTVRSLLTVMIVGAILLMGRKMAKEMSGTFGNAVADVTGKIAGVALGAAVGGAAGLSAFAGRQTVGRAAGAVGRSEWLKDKAVNGNRWQRSVSRGLLRTGQTVEKKGTFDVRQSKVLGAATAGLASLGAQAGIKLPKTLPGMGIGTATGGVAQTDKESEEKRKKKMMERAALLESDKKGALQKDIDRAKARAEDGIGFDLNDPQEKAKADSVKQVKDAQKAVKDAEGELKNKDNPAVAAVQSAQQAYDDYMAATKDKMEQYENELREITKGMSKEEAKEARKDFKRDNSEYSEIQDMRAKYQRNIGMQKRNPTKDPTNIKDVEQVEVVLPDGTKRKEWVNVGESLDLRYKDENDRDENGNPKEKTYDTYNSIQKDIADKIGDVAKAKQTDAYRSVQKEVKDAEKAYNDAQTDRLEAFAGRLEKHVGVKANEPKAVYRGKIGKAYEAFVGSTAGIKGSAKDVRDRVKALKSKSKPDDKKPAGGDAKK